VIDVSLHPETVSGTPPIRTSGSLQSSPSQRVKCCPVIVTAVPPEMEPVDGEMPVTMGERSLMLRVQHWIAPVSAVTTSVARSLHVPLKLAMFRP
jgi:hypothetical protein